MTGFWTEDIGNIAIDFFSWHKQNLRIVLTYNMISRQKKDTTLNSNIDKFSLPDESGRFGRYGGSYVPETLSHPLRELNIAYQDSPIFQWRDEWNEQNADRLENATKKNIDKLRRQRDIYIMTNLRKYLGLDS